MKWFFDNYTKGAVSVIAEQVVNELKSAGARSVRPPKDDALKCLDERLLLKFDYRYHISTNIVWRKNSADCDKWAFLWKADLLRGAIEQGFDLAPCIGLVDFTRPSGTRHERGFARTASGLYLFCEPQLYFRPSAEKWSRLMIGKDYDFEL